MDQWLRIFKHLLPKGARAWRITVDKTLRQFFEGLTGLPNDARDYFDEVFNDLDPQQTRALDEWEEQFYLPDSGLTEQQRRDRLAGRWQALGGQDPKYLQDTLRGAGFDVYVHEWYEPIPGRPGGGSINRDVLPVVRNPLLYLVSSGLAAVYLMGDGQADSQDGDADNSMDGKLASPQGYPLVNKTLQGSTALIGDGNVAMQDGGGVQDGNKVPTIPQILAPEIPTDPNKWPYFLYIGGQTFPDLATIPTSRRDEFENLCLRICPTEQWLGILVNYS